MKKKSAALGKLTRRASTLRHRLWKRIREIEHLLIGGLLAALTRLRDVIRSNAPARKRAEFDRPRASLTASAPALSSEATPPLPEREGRRAAWLRSALACVRDVLRRLQPPVLGVRRVLEQLWDARFALLLLVTVSLWSVLLLTFFGLLDATHARTGLLLVLVLTGIMFLGALLIVEWLGIHNLWKVDDERLSSLEVTHPYLPKHKHTITTLLLTLAVPLALWQMRPPVHATAPFRYVEQRAWQIANDGPQATDDSLVGYWKVDETSGTSAADSSGDGNTGTLTGNPTISSTVAPTAFTNVRSLAFNGSPYVSTPLALPSTAGTISLWAYPTAYADWISPAGWKLLGANNGYILIDEGGSGSPGKWRAAFRPDNSGNAEASVVASASITQNAWNHLVMTWNKSGSVYTIALYVNGTSQGSTTWTGSVGSSGVGNFNFGKSGDYPDNYFQGNVDDVRVYSRALSASEIADLAAGRHPSATWTGNTSTDFEVAGNWSTSAVPDPFTRVTIPVTTNQPVLTTAISLAGLTVNTGAYLSLNGRNLTLKDSGVITNYGTILSANTETLSGTTLPTDKGTVMLVSTGSTTGLSLGNSVSVRRIAFLTAVV